MKMLNFRPSLLIWLNASLVCGVKQQPGENFWAFKERWTWPGEAGRRECTSESWGRRSTVGVRVIQRQRWAYGAETYPPWGGKGGCHPPLTESEADTIYATTRARPRRTLVSMAVNVWETLGNKNKLSCFVYPVNLPKKKAAALIPVTLIKHL